MEEKFLVLHILPLKNNLEVYFTQDDFKSKNIAGGGNAVGFIYKNLISVTKANVLPLNLIQTATFFDKTGTVNFFATSIEFQQNEMFTLRL